MTMEWTNQHGCGGNEQTDEHKLNCEIVIQYMCVPYGTTFADSVDRHNNLDFANQQQGFTDNSNADQTCTQQDIADGTCGNYKTPGYTNAGKHNPATDAADHGLPKLDENGDIAAEGSCFIKRPDNQLCQQITTTNMGFSACTTIDGLDKVSCDKWNAPGSPWAGFLIWKVDPYKVGGAPVRPAAAADQGQFHQRRFRDGTTTNRQDFDQGNQNENQEDRFNRKFNGGNDVQDDRGLHESWEHYDECYRRERNRGLFTADQNLRNNAFGYSSAIYTRQNPNNNRRWHRTIQL